MDAGKHFRHAVARLVQALFETVKKQFDQRARVLGREQRKEPLIERLIGTGKAAINILFVLMHNFSGRDCRDSGLTVANNKRTGKMTPRECMRTSLLLSASRYNRDCLKSASRKRSSRIIQPERSGPGLFDIRRLFGVNPI